ncbi:MAG: stage II sporulation protein M [Acidobacteriota bacterium]
MLKDFLQARLEDWKRLEELTARASKYRLTNLTSEEVQEFGRLYRRTAADLAIAREEVRDRRLVNYLNHLVGRAHGAIYRSESSGFGVFVTFFRYELPAIFRKTFSYTLAAFLAFLLAAAFAFIGSYLSDEFADRINAPLRAKIQAHINWTESVNDANPVVTTLIQSNNIGVTFFAFASGALFGIITFLIMVQNGLLLGMVMGQCLKYSFADVPIFVCAHGVIELTAIFIAGGAGFLIGKALLMPGDLRRIDALVANGGLAIRLILGCIPMLIVAGIIEGFLSPAHVSAWYKFSVAIASAIAMTAYFLKSDLRKNEGSKG